MLILPLRVPPCGCAVLHYMVDAQLFLQRQSMPHREHILNYYKLGYIGRA